MTRTNGGARLTLPERILCLVTDAELAGGASHLADTVDAAIAGGVNMVQLREPGMAARDLEQLGHGLREVTAGRALLLVSRDPALAVRIRADGAQLPEAAGSVREARQTLGPAGLVGRSVHGGPAATQAAAEEADYLICGTVFASRSHPGGSVGGTTLIAHVAEQVDLPVLGIGGIVDRNAAEVMAAGAAGVAVISAIIGTPDPRTSASALAGAIGLTA